MKQALDKLQRVGWPERRAIVGAGVLLIVTRLALRLLPFRTVLRVGNRAGRPRANSRGRDDEVIARLDRMVWAVDVMGNRLFPRNPCLTQALLVQVLFRRAGRPAELRIGVRREGGPKLEAHAWVESDGAIVIGESEASRGYVALPSLGRNA